MKAMVIDEFGGPENFREIDLPKPEPGPGQVLVRVLASSVNPIDFKTRQNGPAFAPALPAVLHGDLAGTVDAVGDGVDGFAPGDEVYGCAGGLTGHDGALAEYMRADARLIAPKPARLGMAEAAALPLVALTAWEGLIDRAKVGPGQKVLVHGGSGGVGHVAIQIAKQAGATVCATASTAEKMALALELGTDAAINYREQSVADYVGAHTGGAGFDVVFDTVGGDNLARCFEAASLYGAVVGILGRGPADLGAAFIKGLTIHMVFQPLPLLHDVGRVRHGQILREVARLADEGKIRPLLDPERFAFTEVADAHRRLESGQAVGKVVLSR